MPPSSLAGVPSGPVAVPAAILLLAGADELTPVSRNGLGGLTWRFGGGYVKWAPIGSGLDLQTEEVKLRWAAAFTTVPPVISAGRDADGSWLHTAALPGENAVSPVWIEQSRTAVEAVGRGLREFHEALPVGDCPFSWSVAERLASAEVRGFDDPPEIDRLVVCHGDACVPNTLLAADAKVVGHVDLGALGVADRWADLAVASWSTEWNYGPGLADALLLAYGVEPDRKRIAFYRKLWDAT